MNFFGNKLNILGLILLGVIVLTLVSSYKEGLQDSVNEKELESKIKTEQQNDESNDFIGDIIDGHKGKEIKGLQDNVDDDTTVVETEVSEVKLKSIDTDVPNVNELPKTELDLAIETCQAIDKSKKCALLPGTHCGYCLDTNKIIAGNKEGPVVDVCSKKGWVPPGKEVAAQ